jgi:hypothetical protein
VGLANLAITFGVSLFIVHGDAADGGETFNQQLQERVTRRVPSIVRTHIRVVRTPLGPAAGPLGAAASVYERILQSDQLRLTEASVTTRSFNRNPHRVPSLDREISPGNCE